MTLGQGHVSRSRSLVVILGNCIKTRFPQEVHMTLTLTCDLDPRSRLLNIMHLDLKNEEDYYNTKMSVSTCSDTLSWFGHIQKDQNDLEDV